MSRAGQTIFNPRSGQTMTFVQTAADTHGRLLRIECSHPPRSPKEPEHVHPLQENRFEVTSGTLTFCIAGKEQTVGPGQTVAVPPGTPHYFWNAGSVSAHYVQEFLPALRIEALFEIAFALAREGKLNDQGRPDALQLAVLMDAYRDELRITHPLLWIQRVIITVLAPMGRLLGFHAEVNQSPTRRAGQRTYAPDRSCAQQ
jgi:mannose-6-phosphate isomerase-like protein (cupin superfamily)